MIGGSARGGDERGFSLAELLVVTAVVGVVMAGVTGIFLGSQQSFLRGTNQIEAQQSARVAIARMIQEIRGAGYDPMRAGFSAITAQTATGLTLQNDWNGNGVIEPGITVTVGGIVRGEQVAYSLSGTDLRRQESGVDGGPLVLAAGVEQLAFQYRDAADAITAVAANIRSVVMTVGTRPEQQTASALGMAQVVMVDRVRLRNR